MCIKLVMTYGFYSNFKNSRSNENRSTPILVNNRKSLPKQLGLLCLEQKFFNAPCPSIFFFRYLICNCVVDSRFMESGVVVSLRDGVASI
jgi:hypothetical protein